MSSGRSGQPDYMGTILGPRVVPATNERRTVVLNDSKIRDGAVPATSRSADDYGKFFPRGMRGTLEEIRLYAFGDALGTVTVNISPHPGLGPTYTATITPPAAWGWVDAAFNVMWNYDSMYVWITACDAAVSWGYDDKKPRDGHHTTDSGVTFIDVDERPFIRVVMTGETAGDVPVSGTVNTIEIPSIATRLAPGIPVEVPHLLGTEICTVEGAGTLVEAFLSFHTSVVPTEGEVLASVIYLMWIYIDNALAYVIDNRGLTQSAVATSGRCAVGEFWQASEEDNDWGRTMMSLRLPLKFRRSIMLAATQTTGATVDTAGGLHVNLLK